jgi:hypothetical protein
MMPQWDGFGASAGRTSPTTDMSKSIYSLKLKVIELNYGREVSTVKPMYSDYNWDPKIVTVIDKWSLFRGSFI